jgi:hypothetical protein
MKKEIKVILENLQNEPCRVRDISENEKDTFSKYKHIQRYYPALDIFKSPDSIDSQKNNELPSKYYIKSWISPDEEKLNIWKSIRTTNDGTIDETCNTFVKVVHLLNPIDMIKDKYVCPKHPLLPQSDSHWKNTLFKIHSHNNQAYVDAIANFVVSRFRELDLTPHCVLSYGATTGISDLYQYNISNEFDTYRQCRWFWKGVKNHNATIKVIKGDSDIESIPNYEEIYKELLTCPFSDDDEEITEIEVDNSDKLDTNEISDVESICSFTFDNIDKNTEGTDDIFHINKHNIRNSSSRHSSEKNSESDDSSGTHSSSSSCSDDVEVDIDICIEVPNMPVILIYQEAQEGVMDALLDEEEINGHKHGTQEWERIWSAWLFQVISALSFLQDTICFTHNDLHTNNIIWRKTDKEFIYYKSKDGAIWRVPTFGKIFSIIDFGRSIFRLGKHLLISDDHWPDQDAGDQYNFGPFFDNTKPKVSPNPSFDLSRLSVSLLDGLYEEHPAKKKGKGVNIMSEEGHWKVYETKSQLFNLLWSWTVDDAGQTIYEDKDGDEKYEGFDLYIHIAQHLHSAVPKEQIHKPIFKQFRWTQKLPNNETPYLIG